MAESLHTEIPDVAPRLSPRVELRGGAGSSSLGGRRRSPSNMIEASMALFRRSELKAAEADVVNVTTRLDSLRARMAGAAQRAEAAVAEQRRLLVETDGADAAALKRVGEACRRAQDDHAAYLEAEAELVRLLEAAQARVAAEHDRIERERVVAERTAQVDRIEAAIAEVDVASRALAVAHRELSAAADAGIDPNPLAGPSAFVWQVTALVQHVAFPRLFTPPLVYLDVTTGRHTVTTPTEAAAPLVAALRARIEEIRSGAAVPLLPVPHPAPPASVSIGEEVIFFVQPAAYHGATGAVVEVEAGGQTVPSPVAARAVAMKVAFREGTGEAIMIHRLLMDRPAHGLERIDETGEIRRVPQARDKDIDLGSARDRIDLGVNLHEWVAAERARLVEGSAA